MRSVKFFIWLRHASVKQNVVPRKYGVYFKTGDKKDWDTNKPAPRFRLEEESWQK